MVLANQEHYFHYFLFGFHINSNRKLQFLLEEIGEEKLTDGLDILFSQGTLDFETLDINKSNLLYTSVTQTPNGAPLYRLYKDSNEYIFVFTGRAIFRFDNQRIECINLLDASFNWSIELYLFTQVLPLWLEIQGIPVLHGSCLNIFNQAFGFLADSGIGKSSLAGEFIRQGYPLISDDQIAVHAVGENFYTYTGYPYLKMWPESLSILGKEEEKLPEVHPLTQKKIVSLPDKRVFRPTFPIPIRALCIIERQTSSCDSNLVHLRRMNHQEAFRMLIKYSYTPYTLKALGLISNRFGFFTRLSQQVDIYQLTYTHGLRHLNQITTEILEKFSGS
jgi:hypothetical protein